VGPSRARSAASRARRSRLRASMEWETGCEGSESDDEEEEEVEEEEEEEDEEEDDDERRFYI
jgi:hypothetical protein